jgi:transposase
MEWLARRRRLVELHVAERNRLEHATDRTVTQCIGRVPKVVEKEIATLDKKIAASIAADPTRCRKAEILDSVPGIAPATAAVRVAAMRKLLTIFNTLIKTDQLWNPKTT